MAGRTSAGLLPVRVGADGEVEVFLGHMGGPMWARKDARAWSVIKGEYVAGQEDPRDAAAREWVEETGIPVPAGEWYDLGEVRQSGGKLVRAYAVLATEEFVVDLTTGPQVSMEWPPSSGRTLTFPELDRAEWCSLPVARERLVAAQTAFLDRLELPA